MAPYLRSDTLPLFRASGLGFRLSLSADGYDPLALGLLSWYSTHSQQPVEHPFPQGTKDPAIRYFGFRIIALRLNIWESI